MKNQKSLDIRYACIQGFYWMIFCAMMGFASVFMLDKGYSNTTIGIVLSLSNIFAVFIQPVLATYMDKTSKLSLRMLISFMIAIMLILSFALMIMTSASITFIVFLIVIFTLMIVIQPFINTLTFAFEKQGIHINFGLARGIGSISYAMISLLLGNAIKEYSSNLLPYFYVGLSLFLLIFVYTFDLPDMQDKEIHEEKSEVQQLSMLQFMKKYKLFMFVLLATVLLFFDHTFVNNFFIQIIQHIGGNTADMGNAVFLAAVLELPTMAYFAKLQKKISCRHLLMMSSIVFSIKHLFTYFAINMTMIYVAQFLQMFAYAIFIPASVYYVNQLMEQSDMVKGQALFTGAMTLGSVFASLVGGVLLDSLGVKKVLLIGAILSIIGTLCMLVSVEDVKEK